MSMFRSGLAAFVCVIGAFGTLAKADQVPVSNVFGDTVSFHASAGSDLTLTWHPYFKLYTSDTSMNVFAVIFEPITDSGFLTDTWRLYSGSPLGCALITFDSELLPVTYTNNGLPSGLVPTSFMGYDLTIDEGGKTGNFTIPEPASLGILAGILIPGLLLSRRSA